MSRPGRVKKRKPTPAKARQALVPPARLTGWSIDMLAAETGIGRVQAFRVLERGVREGTVVRLECGTQTLYARLGGGAISTTPAPGRNP